MHKQRVYIDTSVIGGCFDEEFQEWSNKLFEDFITGKKIAVVSEVVLEELSKAKKIIKNKLNQIPENFLEIIYRDNESDLLAEQYIISKALSPKFSDDALHIALATISKVDILVSWNFKHIVNYNRIIQYNAINLLNGYKQIEIRSPKEVVPDEEDI